MKTIYWIKLTKTEVEHINSLIRMNEEEGSYTPPKMAYWNRSARIRKKLNDISKTCYMFQQPPPIKPKKYKSQYPEIISNTKIINDKTPKP